MAGGAFPALFERALPKSHFWKRYATPHAKVSGDYAELVGLAINIETPDGLGLGIRFTDRIPRPSLGVLTRDGYVEIADPESEHALRGEELEVFARHAALAHDRSHPGVIVALLGRFAPIVDDDPEARVHVAHLAFERVPILTDDVPNLWAHGDYRGAQIRWRREGDHWLLGQPDGLAEHMEQWPARKPRLASKRNTASFPHEALAAAVASAERTCRELVQPWRTAEALALGQRIAGGDRAAIAAFSDAVGGRIPRSASLLDASWLVEILLDQPTGSIAARLPLGAPPRESPVQFDVWMTGSSETASRIRAAGIGAHHSEDVVKLTGLRGPLDSVVERVRAALRAAGLSGQSFCVGDRWYEF
jgi:hypothetical protein